METLQKAQQLKKEKEIEQQKSKEPKELPPIPKPRERHALVKLTSSINPKKSEESSRSFKFLLYYFYFFFNFYFFFALNSCSYSDSEEDDSWSDGDDDILAAQRAEFAATFGSSLDSLVHEKRDKEFWQLVEQFVFYLFFIFVFFICFLYLFNKIWLLNAKNSNRCRDRFLCNPFSFRFP